MARAIVDGGPLYVETDLSRSFPVEPWNTISNLTTVLVVLYWAWALRGRYREHRLVSFALPCLLTAAVGATLYHGTRSSRAFLFLDFVPNLFLGALLVFVFWRLVLGRTIHAVGALVLVVLVRVLLSRTLPAQAAINAGNGLLFLAALIPLLVLLERTAWREVATLVAAAVAFAVAIAARTLDPLSGHVLPMGTHFLWHVFGGVGTFLLIRFLVRSPVLDTGRARPEVESP